jgi:hypothetical protein
MKKWTLGGMVFWFFWTIPALSQRVYSAHSVLASGSWFKIGVTTSGIYKIDAAFLKKLGLSQTNIPSSAFRLFGNGGAMVSEDNSIPRPDDLQENALEVVDGGTGVFGAGAYLLFYAAGPDIWITDSVNRRFSHQKNLYTDTAYYFLSINTGGSGLRVTNGAGGNPNVTVNTYEEHQYHELDSLNFLASGKSWYGEEMADMPGSSTSLFFDLSAPGVTGGSPLQLTTDLLARSIGSPGIVTVSINDTVQQTQTIQATSNGAYALFAYESSLSTISAANADSLHLMFNFSSGALDAQAWLSWWELLRIRALNFEGAGQFDFRDWNSVGSRQVAGFTIGGAIQGDMVWEVTNPRAPVQMPVTLNGTQLAYTNDASRLREYVAFSPAGAYMPTPLGAVPNQDLHAAQPANLLIVTYPAFWSQAQRLATYHIARDTLKAVVVTTSQVFNEFASGSPDPTAIRDFVKMYYDRAGGDTTKSPRYLLLFGDGSYDYKHRIPGNDNLVPCYESVNSLDPLNTYTSDDFFAYLKDADNINNTNQLLLLDIGVGRIPASNGADALSSVNKIVSYKGALGPWRTEMTFVADDGDQNLHLQDAESIAATAALAAPQQHLDKIYLDAYPEQETSAGGRYPEVVQAINGEMYSGTLVLNYSGHGGDSRLSNEDIMDATTISTWVNASHLPLLITATCNFAPYDDPQIRSLGEQVVLQPQNGAIALMTTTRDVFAFSNLVINNNYIQSALRPPRGALGDALKWAKNVTYSTYADAVNNRKFTLLGDPALTLDFPIGKVGGLSLNGTPLKQDTLKALNKYTLAASVTNAAGQLQQGFNGTAYVTVYDKPVTDKTRANNPGSLVTTFTQESSVLYNGKATVTGGKFQVSFVIPKDIDYTLGIGRILYYADNGTTDACGVDSILVGGTGSGVGNDHTGPVIKAYLNDNQFVNGSITNQNPLLLLNLFDSTGINTTGEGVGHDITAVLDNNTTNPYILDKYYQAATNSYQSGTVQFPFSGLTPGEHTLLIRAWDVVDNSSEVTLTFIVEGNGKLVLSHVLNYPNPFTTHTQFWFEHNQPGQPLEVMIRILTVTGKIIKTLRKTIISTGYRSTDLEWDGRDDFGNKLGKGVYLFELQVTTSAGQTATAMNKMVLL